MNIKQFEGHLKGPWKIDRAKYSGDTERIVSAGESIFPNGRVIAVVEDGFGPDIALLAAAPDLLADNKRLREIIGNREWTIKLYDEEIKRLKELIE